MSKKIRISDMTRQALAELCAANGCTINELVDAMMANVVREQISIQINYNKTGELPK